MSDFPTERILRIGTRSSPMALAQVEQVSALLRKQQPGVLIEVVPVTTEADRWQGDLSALGGKGLFVKEIDRMVQRGEVDMAVHCVKDVPGDVPLPEGLMFAACPARDDVRDVLLFPAGSSRQTLADLPAGSVVGTSAVRRKAQISRARPDLRVVALRGTVGNRVSKLDGHKPVDTPLDAMIAATAGLARVGLSSRGRQVFTVDELVPAIGAGTLGLECRRDDAPLIALLDTLNDPRTMTEVTAERALLRGLSGHCNSPIAGHCVTTPDGQLTLHGMVFSADGSTVADVRLTTTDTDPDGDPTALGTRVCAELLRQGAAEIIAGIPH